mmetsp:Transcript_40180/g.107723  ORF Transcript_40180/g.107723 Transcript_40180/m.107723 type:complete len:210 (+) Transcript_40180:2605-3234(+)
MSKNASLVIPLGRLPWRKALSGRFCGAAKGTACALDKGMAGHESTNSKATGVAAIVTPSEATVPLAAKVAAALAHARFAKADAESAIVASPSRSWPISGFPLATGGSKGGDGKAKLELAAGRGSPPFTLHSPPAGAPSPHLPPHAEPTRSSGFFWLPPPAASFSRPFPEALGLPVADAPEEKCRKHRGDSRSPISSTTAPVTRSLTGIA